LNYLEITKKLLPENVKPYLKKSLQALLTKSLKSAAREQNLEKLITKLTRIVPDISEQYSTSKLESIYLKTKVRNQHAFQLALINEIIGDFDKPVIVDIGDSAGTHLQYIIGLFSESKTIRTLSVNVDAKAIDKIKKKGLEAISAKAEDLEKYDINADIFLCFEVLEHLMDPCRFLYELSSKTKATYLVATVPYLKNSRVGLKHIRGSQRDIINAENTHVFELSPEDWKLISKHSGWSIVKEKIYLQYPKKRVPRIVQPLWRKLDFEGFYGLILKRDNTWSSRYQDW
jgi:hypothetical protein